ncbi:DMT family transporter [Sporolactobacillus inulinus]|nr:DMT family transporter [Sporolactobacillus inulinus]
MAALLNAIYIEITGRIIHRVKIIPFSMYQMGFVAAVAFVFSAAFERPHLPDSASVWISVLGLGLLCSAAGYLLQAAAQRYTTSLHAGLIFTLEPIFAVFFAFLADGEHMSFHEYVGAVLVLGSLVIMELKPRFFQHIKGGFRARITQIKTKFSRFVAKI